MDRARFMIPPSPLVGEGRGEGASPLGGHIGTKYTSVGLNLQLHRNLARTGMPMVTS